MILNEEWEISSTENWIIRISGIDMAPGYWESLPEKAQIIDTYNLQLNITYCIKITNLLVVKDLNLYKII